MSNATIDMGKWASLWYTDKILFVIFPGVVLLDYMTVLVLIIWEISIEISIIASLISIHTSTIQEFLSPQRLNNICFHLYF